jgi:cullin-4
MLFENLKFPIDSAQVNLRIESLIERDYLKRDTANAAIYQYIA